MCEGVVTEFIAVGHLFGSLTESNQWTLYTILYFLFRTENTKMELVRDTYVKRHINERKVIDYYLLSFKILNGLNVCLRIEV